MRNDKCSEFPGDYTINFTKGRSMWFRSEVEWRVSAGIHLAFTWSLFTKQEPVKISGNFANAFILVNDIDPVC
jgi:hypothetical protein